MRWDVVVELHQEHHLAVEAPSPEEAQEAALHEMGQRPAEKWDVEIHLEQGVT